MEPPGSRRDHLQVFQNRAILYLKYLRIFRSLEEVYEQLVQPQRRRAVRRVLDGLTGRLLELKTQMVELELSEFHCFDELLLDLKMTPVSPETARPDPPQSGRNQLTAAYKIQTNYFGATGLFPCYRVNRRNHTRG